MPHPSDGEYESDLLVNEVGWPDPPAPATTTERSATYQVENGWWGTLLPQLHQVLAAPAAGRLLQTSGSFPRTHEQLLAHAFAGCYLVGYLLGWSGPTLWKWILAGRPALDDVRLRLLAEVWGRWDYDITLAAALSSDVLGTHHVPALDLGGGYADYTGGGLGRLPADLREAVEPIIGVGEPGRFAVGHGGDGHHLADHLADIGGRQPSEGRVAVLGPHRSVLTLDSAEGWYPAMTNVLHGMGDHWRLAVWCKQVGYMGTWRLSRQTGLPFAGRHRVHVLDFPDRPPNAHA